MVAVANLLGHCRMRQQYRPLIAANPRHRLMLRFRALLYWRLIDCSFGVIGFIPLWLAWRWTHELTESPSPG